MDSRQIHKEMSEHKDKVLWVWLLWLRTNDTVIKSDFAVFINDGVDGMKSLQKCMNSKFDWLPAWLIQSKYPFTASSIICFSRILWNSPDFCCLAFSLANSLKSTASHYGRILSEKRLLHRKTKNLQTANKNHGRQTSAGLDRASLQKFSTISIAIYNGKLL